MELPVPRRSVPADAVPEPGRREGAPKTEIGGAGVWAALSHSPPGPPSQPRATSPSRSSLAASPAPLLSVLLRHLQPPPSRGPVSPPPRSPATPPASATSPSPTVPRPPT